MPHQKPRPKRHRRKSERLLKDRLIQTRVPEDLESALKDAARRRRLSVSHLIRNVLEDTFHLVDHVVAEVDNIVHDSVGLARQVRDDAERISQRARGTDAAERSRTRDTPARSTRREAAEPEPTPRSATPAPKRESLDHVLAWNKVVLNRDAACAKCGAALAKGDEGHLGISSVPGSPPVWLCSACL